MANTTADKLKYLNDTKGLLKQALIDKGVDIPEEATLRSYASYISNISGGASSVLDLSKLEYTKIGSVSIADNIVSNFSDTSYIKLNNPFKPGKVTWQIIVRITTPATFERDMYILSSKNGKYKIPTMYLRQDGIMITLYSIDGSTEYSKAIATHVLAKNKTYLVSVIYDTTAGVVAQMTSDDDGANWRMDGVNWEQPDLYAASDSIFCLGCGPDMNSFFTGQIELVGTYIEVAEAVWWGAKPQIYYGGFATKFTLDAYAPFNTKYTLKVQTLMLRGGARSFSIKFGTDEALPVKSITASDDYAYEELCIEVSTETMNTGHYTVVIESTDKQLFYPTGIIMNY